MKTIALVLCLALGVTACGDDPSDSRREGVLDEMLRGDDPSAPASLPGGVPGGLMGRMPLGAPSPESMMEKVATVELTDEMMEGYVAVLKGIQGAERRMPGAAALEAQGLDAAQWGLITAVLGRAYLTRGRPDQIESLEKRLADAQSRLKGASDYERQILDIQILGYETQLKRLREMPEATDVDRKNHAVLERWKPRLDAAARGE